MKIFNFQHQLAFKQVVRFKNLQYIYDDEPPQMKNLNMLIPILIPQKAAQKTYVIQQNVT